MYTRINKTKIILVLSFLFIFFSNVNTADAAVFGLSSRGIPSTGLNNGLVGWWTFDGGLSTPRGAIADMTGNGNTGYTSAISTSTFYTQGKIGQGLNFDGVNDRVRIAPGSFQFDRTNTFSISFWIKTNAPAVPYVYVPLSKYYFGPGWYFYVNADGSISFLMEDSSEAVFSLSSLESIADNKWHYVSMTYSGNSNQDGMRLYIDDRAVVVGVSSAISLSVNDATANVALGGYDSISINFFKGIIDDVRIYNRELSVTEISNLFNRGNVNISSGSKGLPSTGLNSGLVGSWTFDGKDIVDGVMRDTSGYDNHGNFFNISSSTFFAPGKISQAGKFDGFNDYLAVLNHSSIQFDQTIPFSLSFWYKSTSKLTENSMIAYKSNGFEGWMVYISASDSKVYFKIATFDFSYTVLSTVTVTDGDWHYVTITYSGNSNRNGMSVYVDALSPVVGAVSNIGQTFLNSSTMYMGRNNGSTERVKGYLDNVKLYNRALSESEIQQLYKIGAGTKIASTAKGIPSTGLNSGLLSWWTFDGKDISSGLILDKGTNGNHGRPISIASSTFYTIGKIGQGITLDQSNDYIDIGSNTVLTTGQPFSISWWEKITDNSNIKDTSADYPSRFNFDISGSTRNFLVIRARSNATYTPITFGNAASVPTFFAIKVLTAPSVSEGIGVWNHYVITGSDPNSSTAGDFLFYHNGVSLTTSTGGPFGAATGNRIGLDGAGDSAAGTTLDDVRVYNRRLSAQEVVQLYRQGK